jgi:hypothetical protein
MGLSGLDTLELLDVLGDAVNGLLALHMQEPPISHRDIKVITPDFIQSL